MARPNPCAPPVTTAQRPFRSILFMFRLLYLSNFVIPGCAAWRRPGIHTPGRGYGFRARSFYSRPQMCNCTSGNDEVDDLTYRHADRTDRDPDVVAADGADGCDRQNPGVSTGGDDVRDRRAGGVPDLDRAAGCRPRIVATAPCMGRRGRWSVRLSPALFSGAAFRAPGRSRVVEISLAAAGRAVFVAAARRTAGAAPYHRRRAWTDRHGALVCRQQQRRVRARSGARTGRGVRRRLRVGVLFGD